MWVCRLSLGYVGFVGTVAVVTSDSSGVGVFVSWTVLTVEGGVGAFEPRQCWNEHCVHRLGRWGGVGDLLCGEGTSERDDTVACRQIVWRREVFAMGQGPGAWFSVGVC